MRSLRLEPELDERVRRAAGTEGTTVSEFIRRAVADRADRTLAARNSDRLADLIGAVHAGGGSARDTGAAFGELLAERRRAKR